MAFNLGGALGGAGSGASTGAALGGGNPWAVAGGAAIGGLMGAFGGDDESSNAALEAIAAMQAAAIAELNKVGIPEVEAQKILLESPQDVFKYAPQLEEQYPEMRTAFENIQADPRLKQAQMSALDGLTERAQMGLTPSEKADLDAVKRQTEQQNQARQNTIVQQMEERGQGGSGNQLAMQLAGTQQAAQSQALSDQDLLTKSFNAKQQALMNMGSMATDQRSQDVGEQTQKASASDVMSKYNLQNQMDVNRGNISAQNQAKLLDAQNKQAIEQARAETANTQEQYNKELIQKKFENELALASKKAGVYTGTADTYTKAASGPTQTTPSKTKQLLGAASDVGKLYSGNKEAFNKVGSDISSYVDKKRNDAWLADVGKESAAYKPATSVTVNKAATKKLQTSNNPFANSAEG